MKGPGVAEVERDAEAPRRADAVRNREKVIAAAEAVFAEHGIEAGIPEIAEKAGVGKGTVYRNFESKDELVAAILVRRMNRFDQDILDALESDDPGLAFREALHGAAARASDLSFPAGIYWAGRSPELDHVKARVRKHLAKLVNKAKKSGDFRKDAKAEEVFILFGGICRALGEAGEQDPKVWRRHTDLVVDAFRP
ncbi:MAG: TetR/AcrR family transcriptional regulator [Solirubrobacterales bacterium]|nr:TetR/AcrR family transcriptional regulator [Solirubrobacterales bacterium]